MAKGAIQSIELDLIAMSTSSLAKNEVKKAAGGKVKVRVTAAKTIEHGTALILTLALSDGRSASARFHLYGGLAPDFWDRKYVYKSCSLGQAKATRR